MKLIKNLILLLVFVLSLSACANKDQAKKAITPFSFINQDGNSFESENLAGSIWIADFIFTNCKTVCEPMTAEMAALQKTFEEEGIPVEFVSFTVDPTVDTPEMLKSYVQNFTDDLSNWHLLTGYSQEEIETFAREQFRSIVQKPASSDQVIHGTNFYLIDQQGVLINEYNYVDTSYVEAMMTDIKKTLNQ